MDSQQLIQALHDAQRKAGGNVVKIQIIQSSTKPRGFIEVSFRPMPRDHAKPEIHIIHNA